MKKVQIKYLVFVSVTMFPATKKTKKPGKYKYNQPRDAFLNQRNAK